MIGFFRVITSPFPIIQPIISKLFSDLSGTTLESILLIFLDSIQPDF